MSPKFKVNCLVLVINFKNVAAVTRVGISSVRDYVRSMSMYSNIISESSYDVGDSRQTSVLSSLSVWNHSEDSTSSWRSTAAAPGLAYRVLSPLPGIDADQAAVFDEDPDVVDRATLPRVTKRSPSLLPISPQSSAFNVSPYFGFFRSGLLCRNADVRPST